MNESKIKKKCLQTTTFHKLHLHLNYKFHDNYCLPTIYNPLYLIYHVSTMTVHQKRKNIQYPQTLEIFFRTNMNPEARLCHVLYVHFQICGHKVIKFWKRVNVQMNKRLTSFGNNLVNKARRKIVTWGRCQIMCHACSSHCYL